MSSGTAVASGDSTFTWVEQEVRDTQQRIVASQYGRVIRIQHNDPDVNNAITAGFDRLIVERSEDGGVTFSEISTPSDRPVLVKDVIDYVWYDRQGDGTFYYRTRYLSTKVCENGATAGAPMTSEASTEVLGAGLAIRQVLTPPQLKARYLFGLDLTDDAGIELSDSVFSFYILAAIEWVERELDVRVLPTTFPNEKHDYYISDWREFSWISLDNIPVISIEDFQIQYPSGQTLVRYPLEWVRLNKEHGQIQVVPTSGTLAQVLIGQGGTWIPPVYAGLPNLPHLFEFSYTAGFERVPADVLDLIGKVASIPVLHILGDLIAGAGIANLSLSIDGLSQAIGTTSSATNSGYGARTGNYQKDIKQQLPTLRRYFQGIRMQVS